MYVFAVSDRAAALESALQTGSGSFLRDVLGSEGGTLPARYAIFFSPGFPKKIKINPRNENDYPIPGM